MQFTNVDTGETIDVDIDELIDKGIKNRDSCKKERVHYHKPKSIPEDVKKYAKQTP